MQLKQVSPLLSAFVQQPGFLAARHEDVCVDAKSDSLKLIHTGWLIYSTTQYLLHIRHAIGSALWEQNGLTSDHRHLSRPSEVPSFHIHILAFAYMSITVYSFELKLPTD